LCNILAVSPEGRRVFMIGRIRNDDDVGGQARVTTDEEQMT